MKLNITCFIVFSVILCLPVDAFSQEDVLRPKGKPGGYDYSYQNKKFFLGLEAGLNFNMFSQENNWITEGIYHPTAYDCHESGSGISPHFAIIADFSLTDKLFLHGRFDFDSRIYGNSGSGEDYDTWALQSVPLDYEYELSSSYYGIALLLRYEINSQFFISGGLVFHLLANDIEYLQTGTRLDGGNIGNISYWNWGGCQGFQACEVTSNVENSSSSLAGLEIGFGYKIPLSESIYLVPQGRFQYFITPIADDQTSVEWDRVSKNRHLNALQLAVALWFGI